MRVLFWSERFWPSIGGVAISARRLLPALRNRGHEFFVITLQEYFDRPEEDSVDNIRVVRLPLWNALAERDVRKVSRRLRQIRQLKHEFAPDLVHINFLGASVFFHFQTEDTRPAPLLVRLDSALSAEVTRARSLAGQALRNADWVTCISKSSLLRLRSLLPEVTQRSSVVYSGRPLPGEVPDPLSFTPPRLVFLGRLVPSKGVDVAIDAFSEIVKNFPQARLVIAGEGPERVELEKRAEAMGCGASVDFIGRVDPDEVPRFLNTATAVLVPSRSDGLPNVAVEASLMARPVVASAVDGLPEIIVGKKTGLLVASEDSRGLASAVSYLLDHPAEAARMGREARARAQGVFGWERYVDAYDRLYRTLVSSENGVPPRQRNR